MKKLFIKLSACIVTISFLTQSALWAEGSSCLAPDSARIVRNLGKSLGKTDPSHAKSVEEFERIAVPVSLLLQGGQRYNLAGLFMHILTSLEKRKDSSQVSKLKELIDKMQEDFNKIKRCIEDIRRSGTYTKTAEMQEIMSNVFRIRDEMNSLFAESSYGIDTDKLDLFFSYIRFMEIFRKRSYQKQRHSLNELVDKAKGFVNQQTIGLWLGKKIEVSGGISIECDLEITAFALGEVLSNAYGFKDTGSAIITKIKISTATRQDGTKVIVIEDNGSGFDRVMLEIPSGQDRQNAFIYSKTTKPGSDGLGLAFLWYVLKDQGFEAMASDESSLRTGGARIEITQSAEKTELSPVIEEPGTEETDEEQLERMLLAARIMRHGGQRHSLLGLIMIIDRRITIENLDLKQNLSKLNDLFTSLMQCITEAKESGKKPDKEKISNIITDIFKVRDEIRSMVEQSTSERVKSIPFWQSLMDNISIMETLYRRRYVSSDVALTDLVNKSFDSLSNTISTWYKGHVRTEENTSFKCDQLITSFALGQIFNNAFKLGNENESNPNPIKISQIVISSLQEKDGSKMIVIEDNGPGFPQDMLNTNLKGDRQNAFAYGESGNGSTGLGLAFLWYVLKDQGFNITISNDSSIRRNGARFVITIPKQPPKGGPTIDYSL